MWAEVQHCKVEGTEADTGWYWQHLGEGCQEEASPEYLRVIANNNMVFG